MSRMTRALARGGLVTMVCLLLAATPVRAGGGPQNVLIVYNANPKYPDSHSIAEHYRAARGIHPDQMLGLEIDYADLEVNQPIPGLGGLTFNVTAAPDSLNAWTVLTVEEFTLRVYNPIVAHLAAKGLEDQVYILVFCKGVPWRIWPEVEHDHPLSDAAHPDELNGCAARPEGGFASVLARASFGNAFDLSPNTTSVSAKTTYFATCEAFRPGRYTRTGEADKPLRFLTSMLYGPTIGGNYDAAVIDSIDRAVDSDTGASQGTFVFLSSDDAARGARRGMCGIEVESLRQMGLAALHDYVAGADLPGYDVTAHPDFATAVLGLSLGAQTVRDGGNPWAAWPWAPGAYGEALTSFGGHLMDSYHARGDGWYHTTPEWWIMAGAAGGYGTAMEPGTTVSQLPTRFPAPLQFRRYADGFSMAEVMYQSVEDIRFLMVVGDPLMAPFARRPTVTVNDVPTHVQRGERIELPVVAVPHPEGRAVGQLELYLDGKFLARYEPPCPAGNEITLTLGGAAVSCTTVAGDTRGDILAALAEAVNSQFVDVLTAECRDVVLSPPQPGGTPRWNAELRSDVPTTDGLMHVATEATGDAANGIPMAATVAAGGAAFVHPYWQAGETYGGTQWKTTTSSLNCWVWRQYGSEYLVRPGGEQLVVRCHSGSAEQSATVILPDSWTSTYTIQSAILETMADLYSALHPDETPCFTTGSDLVCGLPGATPEATFSVEHPDHAASGFRILLGGNLEADGLISRPMAGGTDDGPGINYLRLDMGPALLEHVFEIDTSSLALGRHTVMVVAMDGGAAEAQGYFHAEFELSETLEVAATWADDIAWCYENAPQHTGDRHQVELHVAVGGDAAGQGDYEVTVETLSGTTGEVSLETTDDPLLWRVIGGPYDQAAGTVRLGITVRDRAGGATGEAECTMVVRPLGDIDDDGVTSTTDKLAINRSLNGLPHSFSLRAIDITGDGVVDTQDKLLMARILNGMIQ
jgi:dockerin type I repeat protein